MSSIFDKLVEKSKNNTNLEDVVDLNLRKYIIDKYEIKTIRRKYNTRKDGEKPIKSSKNTT